MIVFQAVVGVSGRWSFAASPGAEAGRSALFTGGRTRQFPFSDRNSVPPPISAAPKSSIASAQVRLIGFPS
ncbi:MAG: hypothetical protein V8T86_12590 [Victivallis sp.]